MPDSAADDEDDEQAVDAEHLHVVMLPAHPEHEWGMKPVSANNSSQLGMAPPTLTKVG